MTHCGHAEHSPLERMLRGLADCAAEWSEHKKKQKAACACHIPETECPPRCAARIHWEICRGVTPKATIVVRNVGKVDRAFTFAATPLAGLDVGTAALKVTPGSAVLSPGHRVAVQVQLDGSAVLTPSQLYTAELLITGAWEQCVQVHCYVDPDPTARCEIDQGEVPKKQHAHHWFDHFLCTDECTPGAKAAAPEPKPAHMPGHHHA